MTAKSDETHNSVKEPKREISPLLLTVIGAIVTGAAAIWNSYFQAQQNHQIEVDKLSSKLIQKAIDYEDPIARQKALQFYVKAGLIGDPHGKIMALQPEEIPKSPDTTDRTTIGKGTYEHVRGAGVVRSGLAITSDGAPRAYGPHNSGLDITFNAGGPGNWFGVLVDEAGNPVIQGPNDPAPGFYISPTSLRDVTKASTDPRGYVDSSTVPYITLPSRILKKDGEPKLGDIAAVYSERNGKIVYAIVANAGPNRLLGEGSIALAAELGLPSDPRRGGETSGIVMVVFPKSGNGRPLSREEINRIGVAQFTPWGGVQGIKQLESSEHPDVQANKDED